MRTFTSFFLFILILMACDSSSNQQQSNNVSETGTDETENATSHPGEAETANWIVFFGNSLTAGYGLTQEQAFPALIQEKIRTSNLNYKVYNAGESGATSADGVSRIDFLLDQIPPINVFVLELGANDGLRGISTEETQRNLQEIIDRVKTRYPDVSILIAGMEVPPNMGEQYADEFREIFRNLAVVNQTALIPFLLEGVAGDPDVNQDDGIHPTAKGHIMVADHVWTFLRPLL